MKNKTLLLADKGMIPYLRPQIIFKKISLAPCFFAKGGYYIIATKFSLSTCKTGYGETVSRPHPTEGRVALRTGLHGHLPWLRAKAGR